MTKRIGKRTPSPREEQEWRLEGYDAFDEESYPISGGPWRTYETVRNAAMERLRELEERQPSSNSGGQGVFGIQDRVFIVHPNGRRERVMIRLSTDVVDLTVYARDGVEPRLVRERAVIPFVSDDDPKMILRTTFFAVDAGAIELFRQRWDDELTRVEVSNPYPASDHESLYRVGAGGGKHG